MVTAHLLSKDAIASYAKTQRYHDITLASVRYLLSRFPDGSNLLIKTTASLDFWMLPVITKNFPAHRITCALRSSQGVVRSFYRAIQNHIPFNLLLLFVRTCPAIFEPAFRGFLEFVANGLLPECRDFAVTCDIFTMFFLQWTTNIATLQRNARGLNVHCVYYEDTQKDKEGEVRKVR